MFCMLFMLIKKLCAITAIADRSPEVIRHRECNYCSLPAERSLRTLIVESSESGKSNMGGSESNMFEWLINVWLDDHRCRRYRWTVRQK